MGVFIAATRATVRKIAHPANNDPLYHLVELLVAMVDRPYFRVHQGYSTLANRALHHHPDHLYSSPHPSISTSTVPRHGGIRVSHRVIRHFLRAKDPVAIRHLVLRLIRVERARVEENAKVKLLAKHK